MSRELGADGPRQWRRESEAKVDGLEGLSDPHYLYEDQAEDTLIIPSFLVDI